MVDPTGERQNERVAARSSDAPPQGDGDAGARPPWLVLDIDVARGIPPVEAIDAKGRPVPRAWILVRLFDEPLGTIELPIRHGRMEPAAVEHAFPAALVCKLRARLEEAGVPWQQGVPLHGCTPARQPPFLARRDRLLGEGPSVTAVVCTRDRPDGLRRCLLSLQAQSYPRLSLLVVDNGAESQITNGVVKDTIGPHPLSYVHEPNPGLSNARNRSIAESDADIIAWIDDDETADEHWVCELVRGFTETPESSAVCGVMIPAELETQAQIWFEEYGGHSKGRGFKSAVFSPSTVAQQSPLFPLPPFGTGGNMALRRSALGLIGEFNPALGAGTATMGAEDTRALTDILLGGGTVRYQATAVTRHFHRREYSELERQMFGYGLGLTAYYTSLVIDKPSLLFPLLKLAPRALKEFRDPQGTRLAKIGPEFPDGLLRVHRRGLLKGPFQYVRARHEVRRSSAVGHAPAG